MNSLAAFPLTRFAGSPRPRVLVVDDSDFCRKLFAAILSSSGHQVETAVNGADALLRLAEQKFDLVLTDSEMPVLDGGRLVLALRSAGIDTPVIMLSGSFAGTPLPDAIVRRVSVVMAKPIDLLDFLATVGAVLGHSRQPALCAA